MDVDDGVHVGHRRDGRRGALDAAGHHATGGRGHIQCRTAEGAIAVRMNLGNRSAKVSHAQSVGSEEPGDKLSGVTALAQTPLEAG